MKKTRCPNCGGIKIEERKVEGNLRSEYSWSHDSLKCMKCGCEFTIWEDGELEDGE